MTSTRTLVRDAVVAAFEAARDAEPGVRAFEVSVRWLHEQETAQHSTYCILTTDETCTVQTLQHDNYELTIIQVLYAYDTRDPRAKLDGMIEDAMRITRAAAHALKDVVWRQRPDSITTDDATTAAGSWAQAVLRWTVSHRRPVMAV